MMHAMCRAAGWPRVQERSTAHPRRRAQAGVARDAHPLTVEQIVLLVQVGMDKPYSMAARLHRLAHRLDPLRGDGKDGQVARGVHSDRRREAVPPGSHITKTRAPCEWRMLGRDKRRRVLV